MTPHAEIRGSIKSIAGVRICETAALVLRIDNQSQIDLRSIHLALVRCVSFASELSDASHASSTIYDYTPPEPTIVHNATIPIAKVSNANSSWSQQLQLRLPFSTEIVPTINASVTPLLRVDYFILVSIPVPQRHNNLVSRFTSSTRKRPTIDLSIFNRSISSSFRERLSTDTPSPNISHTDNDTYEQLHQLLLSPEPTVLSAIKGAPMALQFPPIPILVGTIPSIASQRKSP
ncbi:hypothetical protein BCR41DRAFT_356132 [Lobosporangium transversale]|uniref:Arrestin C-terminal-like domain-containing protein n=1 Tax=Lobosporangium transversale TaxID=64571 RepID=A0A1Y2GLD2_9FUNG|nr:hypothetical protein BCR41DRAFT_356132 [Lobosporangium transversale]ORZ12465.1 hypothetical protein BCR41DRAFT_356132 [Lobosporangium transversale]|eukprot:XP_021880084.1 hypothetical protein BCR41DRAFT_356132 [Lobosporangium transversale]